MIKTNKSKKKRIGLILCSLFICLCSILCIVPFNNNQIEVKADEVVTNNSFYGSNLLFYTSPFSPTFNITGESIRYLPLVTLSFFEFDFHFIGSNLDSINISGSCAIETNNNDGTSSFDSYHSEQVITDFTSNIAFGSFHHSYNGVSYSDCYINIGLTFSNINNGVVTFGVPIGYTLSGKEGTFSGSFSQYTYYINYLTYFDVDGNFVEFAFIMPLYSLTRPIEEYPFPNFVYENRTYYFEESLDLTTNEYYNQGYFAGKTDGYNIGYSAGETAGYNAGYSVGNNIGYNNGFSDGVEDSNQYTFLNLLSATIDVPIKYFQSLFNFELLGVNLQGFLTGLFTLCVIVTIIKMVL